MEETENLLFTDLDETTEVVHVDAVGLNIEFGNNSNDALEESDFVIVGLEGVIPGKDNRWVA